MKSCESLLQKKYLMKPLSDIIFTVAGNIGVITLNRPQALNATSVVVLIALYQQLKQWEQDTHIKAVMIKSNHAKAFCAGGDLREIYQQKQKTGKPFTEFFWHEYRLNYYIANYPKPFIALMDGITMGGGAGISVHGSHRIATEHTVFAMPETSIGFFPDIGSSYFLSRCPGQTGIYLALTSAYISAADTQYLGLTDYYVNSAKLPELINVLVENSAQTNITKLIKKFSTDVASTNLATYHQLIDRCFCFNTVEEIIAALNHHSNQWCKQTVKSLTARSPTSLKVTLEQLHRGSKLNLANGLKMEYRIVNHMLYQLSKLKRRNKDLC